MDPLSCLLVYRPLPWGMRALTLALATTILTTAAQPAAAQQRYRLPPFPIRYSPNPTACGEGLWGRDALRFKLEQLMTAIDSGQIARRRLYKLPAVPPDSIRMVTDPRICERAARTYYRHHLGPLPLEGIAVAEVGDLYAVYGARRAGEWTILEIQTRDFVRVGSIMN